MAGVQHRGAVPPEAAPDLGRPITTWVTYIAICRTRETLVLARPGWRSSRPLTLNSAEAMSIMQSQTKTTRSDERDGMAEGSPLRASCAITDGAAAGMRRTWQALGDGTEHFPSL